VRTPVSSERDPDAVEPALDASEGRVLATPWKRTTLSIDVWMRRLRTIRRSPLICSRPACRFRVRQRKRHPRSRFPISTALDPRDVPAFVRSPKTPPRRFRFRFRLHAENKEKDPATYNILVKKTGPLNVTWNGVGMLQVPKGKDDKESNNVAKTVLLQRKEVLMGEVARLYPKMTGKKDFVIQMFEDPYADPVDMDQAIPEGMELVPAEIKWMKKGKRYPF
jgi:hypothetical protein